MLLIDPQSGAIMDANKAAALFYGYPRDRLCTMFIQDINTLTPEEVKRERLAAAQQERNYFVFNHKLAGGDVRTVEVYSWPVSLQGKEVLFSVIQDITLRKTAEAALRKRTTFFIGFLSLGIVALLAVIAALLTIMRARRRAEAALDEKSVRLQRALDEVKTLRGIVPICANCKKIRDDKGYWNQVERYISEHSEAKFSHSICPECLNKLYPEFVGEESGAKP
jgi:PAS domain S-box-containing protein